MHIAYSLLLYLTSSIDTVLSVPHYSMERGVASTRFAGTERQRVVPCARPRRLDPPPGALPRSYCYSNQRLPAPPLSLSHSLDRRRARVADSGYRNLASLLASRLAKVN